MKTKETILTAIKANKEIQKNIKKLRYYSDEHFFNDVKTYISAIKTGRMLCIIDKVRASGMSRTITFKSCEKSGKKGSNYFRNYNCLFIALGYSEAGDYFRINGCGMDMIFYTNYSNIHDFKRLGFLTEKECEKLAQMTPAKM